MEKEKQLERLADEITLISDKYVYEAMYADSVRDYKHAQRLTLKKSLLVAAAVILISAFVAAPAAFTVLDFSFFNNPSYDSNGGVEEVKPPEKTTQTNANVNGKPSYDIEDSNPMSPEEAPGDDEENYNDYIFDFYSSELPSYAEDVSYRLDSILNDGVFRVVVYHKQFNEYRAIRLGDDDEISRLKTLIEQNERENIHDISATLDYRIWVCDGQGGVYLPYSTEEFSGAFELYTANTMPSAEIEIFLIKVIFGDVR